MRPCQFPHRLLHASATSGGWAMTFEEILDQAIAMLQRRGRLTYGALKRQFNLDDAYLDDVKAELIEGQRLAVDEAGRVLVWVGDTGTTPAPAFQAPQSPTPPADCQTAQPTPHGLSAVGPPPPEAERRQLTILFCDLVGSTALSRELDPEDYRAAVRLDSLAAPNTVVISAALHHLVQGYFIYDDLGAHTLKGVDTPFQVYRVLGESGAQSRLDVPSPRGLTPLVGREAEVTLLLDRWAQVKDGLGQVVLLSGEAGIGKSRLVQVLKDHLAGEPYTLLECRCSPYHTNSALYSVIDLW